jgi:hypothetical protein
MTTPRIVYMPSSAGSRMDVGLEKQWTASDPHWASTFIHHLVATL